MDKLSPDAKFIIKMLYELADLLDKKNVVDPVTNVTRKGGVSSDTLRHFIKLLEKN